VGSYECGDEPLASGTTELVICIQAFYFMVLITVTLSFAVALKFLD
jgi:hypothetical protein